VKERQLERAGVGGLAELRLFAQSIVIQFLKI